MSLRSAINILLPSADCQWCVCRVHSFLKTVQTWLCFLIDPSGTFSFFRKIFDYYGWTAWKSLCIHTRSHLISTPPLRKGKSLKPAHKLQCWMKEKYKKNRWKVMRQQECKSDTTEVKWTERRGSQWYTVCHEGMRRRDREAMCDKGLNISLLTFFFLPRLPEEQGWLRDTHHHLLSSTVGKLCVVPTTDLNQLTCLCLCSKFIIMS